MQGDTEKLIVRGEGLTIEFKQTIQNADKIAKSIAAFANTSGGVLLIGVADDKSIFGVRSELKELKKLEKAAKDHLDPPVQFTIQSLILSGKKVLRIQISEGNQKPYFVINQAGDRIIYIRVKDKSVPVPRLLFEGTADTEVQTLLASRHVKSLIQYLKENDLISSKEYAKMINISTKRADRMLQELAQKHVLIKHIRNKNESYSLKYTEG